MYSFIRELYYGNVNPQKQQSETNSNCAKAMQKVSENEDRLTELLNGDEKKLFLDYANAWGEILGGSLEATFVDGFRIGAFFAFDAFACSENVFEPISEGMF